MISGHCGGKAEPLKSPPCLSVCLLTCCQMTIFCLVKECRTLWGQGWAIEVSSLPVCLPFDWLSDDNILFSKRMQDIVGVAPSHWRRFCLFSRPKTSYNTSSCWLLVFLFSLQIIYITFNVKQVFTSITVLIMYTLISYKICRRRSEKYEISLCLG